MSEHDVQTTVVRRLGASAVVAAIAFSALAACASSSDLASGPAPPAPTVEAPTPTVPGSAPISSGGTPATPPADRLTDVSRLRLDGIGPVTVGMTLSEASAAAHTTVRVVGSDMETECHYAQAEDGPAGLRFMVIDRRIVRIDVSPSPPEPEPSPVSTRSGIHIGSTEDEVRITYPGRIRTTRHPYLETGRYLVYEPVDTASSAFGLIFETDGERVTSFRSGESGAVQAIEGCA